MKTSPSKIKCFLWMFIPITHSITYHYEKEKKSFCDGKFIERPETSEGPLGVLLRFRSDRILFDSSVIRSSSWSSVMDSSLVSLVLFLRCAAIFYQNVPLSTFFIKSRCSVLYYIFKKIFTPNNLQRKKWRNTCIMQTRNIILKIYVINFLIYNKLSILLNI